MRKNRRFRTQRAVQQHLFGSVRKVVRATNHVSDAHIDVVDDHPQLIHGLAEFLVVLPGTQQDKVLDFIVGELALPKYRVQEFRGSTKGNFEAHRRFHTRRRGPALAAGTARDPT